MSAEVSEFLASQLPDVVGRDQDILESCANALPSWFKYNEVPIYEYRGEPIYMEGKQVFCGIDQASGWFNIGIRFENFTLVFRAALYD
jgi:hypothetical protein